MEGIEKAVPSVKLTENLISKIKDALECENVEKETRTELALYSAAKAGSSIPFESVKQVYQALRKAGKEVFLHEMLSDSDLVLPGVKFPPRNPELEARIQRLKAEAANKEYRKMTENVDPTAKQEVRFQEDVKSLNRQMIAVFNFLITVVGAFAFGYKGVEVALGSKLFPMQMMSGLILGTVVFFADLYFLLKYSPQ